LISIAVPALNGRLATTGTGSVTPKLRGGDFGKCRDSTLVALDGNHTRRAFGQKRTRQPARAGTDLIHNGARDVGLARDAPR
jgi:hypothetical protein